MSETNKMKPFKAPIDYEALYKATFKELETLKRDISKQEIIKKLGLGSYFDFNNDIYALLEENLFELALIRIIENKSYNKEKEWNNFIQEYTFDLIVEAVEDWFEGD